MRRALGVVLLAVAVLAGALAAGWRDNPLADRARDYAQTIAATSAATYVGLRTVNAFLSTAQEVEVGGSFFASGTVQPLKVLEPIDDTVERVAGMIFAMMVATGLLAVALGPVGAVGLGMVALACGIAGLGWVITGRSPLAALTRGLGAYGLFLAVALPASFVIAALGADAMTGAVWQENQRVIAEITRGVADASEAQDTGVIAALTSLSDYRTFAASVYDNADALVGSYVMILAVFIFKIFLLPALILGGFFVLARVIARAQPKRAGDTDATTDAGRSGTRRATRSERRQALAGPVWKP